MTSKATVAPKNGRTNGSAPPGVTTGPSAAAGPQKTGASPARASSSVVPGGAKANAALDTTISKAQQGRVNITPAKAIAMAGKLFSEGNLKPAEKVCRQVIAARPGNADAHNILGVTLNSLGQPKNAIASLQRAIKLRPEVASYHANLAEVLRQSKKNKESQAASERALALDPGNAQAHNNLGIILYDQKQYEEAADHYRAAIAVRPDMPEAHNNLGNALRATGDRDGASKAYHDALLYRERYPEAYNNIGTLLHQERKFDEAEHSLQKAIQQSPKYIEAYNNLANTLSAQKKDVDALRVLGDALKIAPKNVATLLITSRIQMRRNSFDAAERAIKFVLDQEPDNLEAKVILGQLFHETDRYDQAVTILEEALAGGFDSPEARNFYGVALKSVGRLDEAREQILKGIDLNESMYGAYSNINDLIDFKDRPDLVDKMQVILESSPDLEADQLLPLHYAYAKALDDLGEHERALDHYITGGRMKRAQLDYKEEESAAFFDNIRAAFPKEIFDKRPFEGIDDERPVFIVGMPRSGSTLVEQILSSHPDVYGAGEVKYLSRALSQSRDRFPSLPKFPHMMEKLSPAQLELMGRSYLGQLTAQSGGARRVTDKLLTNYFFVGLIHLLFPKARIINTMRDPVDTCLSAFTKLFKDDMPHSYKLDELGRYYGKYRELMKHWNDVLPAGTMATIHYEDTVASTESEAKRLIEFLGLEWNEACLDFHNSARPVKTASVAQVRKPIYNTAVKRWKKYGDGLKPLVEAIG